MRTLINKSYRIVCPALLCSLLLAGCADQKVIEHQTAVPVEKLVYLPIDWSKFQECSNAPPELIIGKTNSDMRSNGEAWKLRAECLDDEIQKIQSLQIPNSPKP